MINYDFYHIENIVFYSRKYDEKELLKYRNIYSDIHENNSQNMKKHWENCIVKPLKACMLCVTIDA